MEAEREAVLALVPELQRQETLNRQTVYLEQRLGSRELVKASGEHSQAKQRW